MHRILDSSPQVILQVSNPQAEKKHRTMLDLGARSEKKTEIDSTIPNTWEG